MDLFIGAFLKQESLEKEWALLRRGSTGRVEMTGCHPTIELGVHRARVEVFDQELLGALDVWMLGFGTLMTLG